jgi:Tfp pilus assembly protein PilF
MNLSLFLLPRMLAAAALLSASLLSGCASVDNASVAAPGTAPPALSFTDEARFGASPAIEQPAAILALTPAQQAAFLSYLNDPYYQSTPLHQRVYGYLESFTAGFHYQGETLTASEAFAGNTGNCLSLALMTTALADLAGVRIGYQLLDDVPVFEFHGTVVEKGYHVRSILYNPSPPGADPFMLQGTGLKIDYFPSERQRFVANLTRGDFIAMYYRNIAAGAIALGDFNKAYWYLRQSLQYAANDSQAINMLAVVSRRTGDEARAEELYRFGLAHSQEKLTLLKNYRVLLSSQGRNAEAEQVQQQLNRMDDPSPFHWFQLARESATAGDYRDAVHYYRRALALAPYMHEAYLGVAQAQYEMGDSEDAIASLQQALENVYRSSTRKLYKAKLYSMTH